MRAIVVFRNDTGGNLKEASEAVEALARELGVEDRPKPFGIMLTVLGFAGALVLIAMSIATLLWST